MPEKARRAGTKVEGDMGDRELSRFGNASIPHTIAWQQDWLADLPIERTG